MPLIDVECPSCGVVGKVDDAHVGRTIKCRSCGNQFEVEAGETYDLTETPPERPKSAPTAPIRREPPRPLADEAPEQPKSWLEPWPTD